MRLILFLLVFTFGCERSVNLKDVCTLQGFNTLKTKKISCKDELVISTVEFSNGVSRKLVQGIIKLNKQKYPFTVVLDSMDVIQHSFPLAELDTSSYDCTIRYTSSKTIEIQWEKDRNRLFLLKEFTLAH